MPHTGHEGLHGAEKSTEVAELIGYVCHPLLSWVGDLNVYEYLVLCRDFEGGLSLHARKAETLQRPSEVDARMARDK
jgi:hypothetical protein